MGLYKVDIDTNSLKTLNKDELDELFIKYKNGDTSAKDKIVEGNLKLVLSLIKNYNNGKNDMNDIFQVGCIGLIKAIDNFDINVGVRFSTYAVPLILGEVKRFIRDSSALRISRSIKDLSYHILKFKDKFFSINGREATDSEIMAEMGINEYTLIETMNSIIEPISIYEPIYNDGGDTIYLLDQIKDEKECIDDNKISVYDAIDNLSGKDKKIIYDRYIYGKTQTEMANEMGVSQAQVSRMEKNAINQVKKLVKK